jgi:hypothetical protein
MGSFTCFQDKVTVVMSCGTASKDESLKRSDERGVDGGNEGAGPSRDPLSTVGVLRFPVLDSRDASRGRLGAAVFDLMTGFAAV